MSAKNLPLLGNEIIDQLRMLQGYLDDLNDPVEKQEVFTRGVEVLPLYELAGVAEVTASNVIGFSPDIPNGKIIDLERPVTFSAQPSAVLLRFFEKTFEDSIVVNLKSPVGRPITEVDELIEVFTAPDVVRVSSYQVAVTAIKAWELTPDVRGYL